jgi:oligopeptide/dipeptide ABC transporter ATP-binding protein
MSIANPDSTTTAVEKVSAGPLLSVQDLVVEFEGTQGPRFRAIDHVSLDVAHGEVVAVVGESGSGKSVTARSILRLVPYPGRIRAGKVIFEGRDVLRMSPARVRQLRGQRIAMVFQDPMTSLNPVRRVGSQIAEAIWLHARLSASVLAGRVLELLRSVGIPSSRERARNYPHEYSGGMRQRAMIAMGVANSPSLLIADEPTTALDVTVQDQIITLLRELNRKSGTAILLITHNVALVASLCSRVVVMYAGRVVEEGPTETIFNAPQHPYTWSLLQSVPRIDRAAKGRLLAIRGQPPNPRDQLDGCKFHPRCPFAIARCRESEPPLDQVGAAQKARCWVLMRNVPEEVRS